MKPSISHKDLSKRDTTELIIDHLIFKTLKVLKVDYFDGLNKKSTIFHTYELYAVPDADEDFYRDLLKVWLKNAHAIRMEIKK